MVNICNVFVCVDIIVIFSHCRSRFSNKALLLCLKKFLLGKVWSEGGEFSENFPIGVWIINGKLMRSVIPRIIIKFIFTTFTITSRASNEGYAKVPEDSSYCGVNALALCVNSVLNMKALVGAFNQENALVGAFSVIVKSSGTFK